MMRLLVFVLGACMQFPLPAAELILEGVNEVRVYENQTYEHVVFQGSKHISLRNCTITGARDYHRAAVEINGSAYITVENCVIDCNAKACNGINVEGSARVLIKGCDITNGNDDGIEVHDATLTDIVGNRIYDFLACGNGNGCSPCNNGHTDGIELTRSKRINIIGNILYGQLKNAALYFSNPPSKIYSEDVAVYNNIFNAENGYMAYIWYGNRVWVYNNYFGTGKFGSVWWGGNLYDTRFANNIVWSKWKWNGSYQSAEHHINNNLFKNIDFDKGSNNIIKKDPLFAGTPNTRNPQPEMFALKSTSPCINKGESGQYAPSGDFYGNLHNGLPDIGPIEYNGIPQTSVTAPALPAELSAAMSLQVYPLPMTSLVYFSTARMEMSGPVTVRIYDQQGRIVAWLNGAEDQAVVTWNGCGANGKPAEAGLYHYIATQGTAAPMRGILIKTVR